MKNLIHYIWFGTNAYCLQRISTSTQHFGMLYQQWISCARGTQCCDANFLSISCQQHLSNPFRLASCVTTMVKLWYDICYISIFIFKFLWLCRILCRVVPNLYTIHSDTWCLYTSVHWSLRPIILTSSHVFFTHKCHPPAFFPPATRLCALVQQSNDQKHPQYWPFVREIQRWPDSTKRPVIWESFPWHNVISFESSSVTF